MALFDSEVRYSSHGRTGIIGNTAPNANLQGEMIVKFLSVYKSVERGVPPTQEEMDKMGRLIEQEMKAGTLLATEGCLPSALGARVRMSGGKVTVTDGPFTEAKEVIGGFAILQANLKAEAIEMTKRFLQVAGEGECELRQIFEAPQAHCAGKS